MPKRDQFVLHGLPPKHDLPPSWDGVRVEWEGWQTGQVFICGPGKRAAFNCEECHSSDSPHTNIGIIHPTEPELVDCIKRTASGRTYWSKEMRVPNPHVRLHAQRCPACGSDVVIDTETDEHWTLDETDYGESGSWPTVPALPGLE